jgi:hypothetical protein
MDEPVETDEPGEPQTGCGTLLFAFGATIVAALLLVVLPIGHLGVAILIGGLLLAGVVAFHYFAWAKWVLQSSDSSDEGGR